MKYWFGERFDKGFSGHPRGTPLSKAFWGLGSRGVGAVLVVGLVVIRLGVGAGAFQLYTVE